MVSKAPPRVPSMAPAGTPHHSPSTRANALSMPSKKRAPKNAIPMRFPATKSQKSIGIIFLMSHVPIVATFGQFPKDKESF